MSERLDKDKELEPAGLCPAEAMKSEAPEEADTTVKSECKTIESGVLGAKQDKEEQCSFFKKLFLPWEGEDAKVQKAPEWLSALCALALIFMLNQVKLPAFGGKVAFGDIAFLVAFVPVFLFYLLKRRGFFFPMCTILVLAVAAVANIGAASGMGGAFDVAQLVQQLLCGTLLMGFLVENAPGLGVAALLVALLANIGVACSQAISYGFSSLQAPADILKLKWGFGEAYTGLFRSRMALSFFLGTALAWIQPILFGRKSVLGAIAAFIVTVACLLAIPHGEMLFIVCLVLIPGAFLHSRHAGIVNLLAVLAAFIISSACLPAQHRETWLATSNPMKTGDYPGELRTNHIDFAAALKMAARRPFSGVGAGRYQQCVGRCYEDLPNPSYNDIDTDTQASWGIISGTMGFTTMFAFLILLASSAASGIRRYFASDSANTIALGGGLALIVVILGMFVSDPFTRGLCWMVVLALASTAVPNVREAISPVWRVAPASVIAIGIVLAVLLGVVALKAKEDDPLKSSLVVAAKASAQTDENDAQPDEAVFKIIDAGQVIKMTPPFEKGTDSLAYKGTALKIPDEKGKPPEGKEPAMEYGGAEFEFEMPDDATCKVWLRVWWDGSCGNTINLQIDDEPKSVTVGNDGTYRVWHWLEAPKTYKLTKGKHNLKLLNREDGIMFDQLLITSDSQYVPQEIEEEE